jgi:hypothetical protein
MRDKYHRDGEQDDEWNASPGAKPMGRRVHGSFLILEKSRSSFLKKRSKKLLCL